MMGFLRAFVKDLYNTQFPVHRPWCRKCGKVKENYYLDPELYKELVGVLDCLCFSCMDQMRQRRGDKSTLKVTREQP
jgi:hypothetical protein